MIIALTEKAICERLRQGMGRMVEGVHSYGGEMDAEPAEVIRRLPAAWVTFGGIQKTENTSITKRKYKTYGRFVVIVGERNVRSEEATRQGGPGLAEVGTYKMVEAVRRLLSGQDLGLKIAHLVPGRVRTLFNTKVGDAALSVFACEFDTYWVEEALENGLFPDVNPPADSIDTIFNGYLGNRSGPEADWLTTHLRYDIPQTTRSPDAEDIIHHDNTES
ncbi:DUF1834 family protein [Yersinia kristensenii]|uniref:DUF1834 family protein n=1 Tax=Yersinia kristensenii TaxID=28152 RepID=UPI00285372D0|nr:DUF1834 family protein [Yersinia kristensenii]MDR4896014.1 DUF1834 family protein [Yersinia kristensenii]MDX6734713.1 DUF1834 family protein [Yersinia kristensenii]